MAYRDRTGYFVGVLVCLLLPLCAAAGTLEIHQFDEGSACFVPKEVRSDVARIVAFAGVLPLADSVVEREIETKLMREGIDPDCFRLSDEVTVELIDTEGEFTQEFLGEADFAPSDSATQEKPRVEQLPPPDQKRPGAAIPRQTNTAGEILNKLKWVFELVHKGRPVVDIDKVTGMRAAYALPGRVWDNWDAEWPKMTGWQLPKAVSYVVSARNIYGIEVIRILYRIQYNSGGSYEGRGKYLQNVRVTVPEVNIVWGFGVEANAFVDAVLNFGTLEEPVGALPLTVLMSAQSVILPIQKRSFQASYTVFGDGRFAELGLEGLVLLPAS